MSSESDTVHLPVRFPVRLTCPRVLSGGGYGETSRGPGSWLTGSGGEAAGARFLRPA